MFFPVVQLPPNFNMEHLRKFAIMYTELIQRAPRLISHETYIYSNGNTKLDVVMSILPKHSDDDDLRWYAEHNMSLIKEMKIIGDIWNDVLDSGNIDFTKEQMIVLNKVYKNIRDHNEYHTAYSQQYDPYGTWYYRT